MAAAGSSTHSGAGLCAEPPATTTRLAGMGRERTLPERHGRVVLLLLGLIVVVGLGLRLIGVIDPIDSSYQGADAARYERIAALLYTDQEFAVPGSDAPYDWSPGAPLFYAGIYYVTGGVHPALGRLAIALLGLVTIVICYLLGRRLNGPAVPARPG